MTTCQVEIMGEQDRGTAWSFDVQVLDGAGVLRRHELRLSWADYNLWSRGGADPPQRVAQAVLHFLLARWPPDQVPAQFDAALARRRFPDADQLIPTLIAPD